MFLAPRASIKCTDPVILIEGSESALRVVLIFDAFNVMQVDDIGLKKAQHKYRAPLIGGGAGLVNFVPALAYHF